ncbi:MAG TPA: dihydropteroate synthase [Acidimicrobiales bacterium]
MTAVMGVLNVTPDSFSDGGKWLDPAAAISHGLQLVAEGADIVDVGGESTRPGAQPVAVEEELRRVLPVVEALAGEVTVSIDTRKAAVAQAAVGAGASIVNDVSASLWEVAAETGAGWVAMHMPADPSVMQQHAVYDDVVSEVLEYLLAKAEKARAGGVERVWIDPGIGFGKTGLHNLLLLRNIDRFVASGWPVLVGTSRKSFLGTVAPASDGTPALPTDRVEASVATTVWAMTRGVDVVRVHDVRPVVQAARLAGASGSGHLAGIGR